MLIMRNIYFQKEKLQWQDFEFLFSSFMACLSLKLSCDWSMCNWIVGPLKHQEIKYRLGNMINGKETCNATRRFPSIIHQISEFALAPYFVMKMPYWAGRIDLQVRSQLPCIHMFMKMKKVLVVDFILAFYWEKRKKNHKKPVLVKWNDELSATKTCL